MLDTIFLNDLIALVEKHDLGGSEAKNKEIANLLFEHYKSLPMLLNGMERESEVAFIDRMYSLYPTKCPKRGTSLGKSHKDKQRIKKLLKGAFLFKKFNLPCIQVVISWNNFNTVFFHIIK